MIFITVGTQAPFDRLIRAVDCWAGSHPEVPVIAQIGEAAEYVPRNCRFIRMLSPQRCRQLMQQSNLVIAHAGMGTVLSALEMGRPLIVVPRRAAFGEQRNDHQLATADQLRALQLVHVASDETEIGRLIGQVHRLASSNRIGTAASRELVGALRHFLVDVSLGRQPSVPRWRRELERFAPVPKAAADAC